MPHPSVAGRILGDAGKKEVTFGLPLFSVVQLSWVMLTVCWFLSHHGTKWNYISLTCCKSTGSKFRLPCNWQLQIIGSQLTCGDLTVSSHLSLAFNPYRTTSHHLFFAILLTFMGFKMGSFEREAGVFNHRTLKAARNTGSCFFQKSLELFV